MRTGKPASSWAFAALRLSSQIRSSSVSFKSCSAVISLRSGIISVSGRALSSKVRTINSRLRSVSFQCTFFNSSPSCHLRISEGEALSSVARDRNSGPTSEAFSSMAGTACDRG